MNTFESPEIQLVTLNVPDLLQKSNETEILPFSEQDSFGLISLG